MNPITIDDLRLVLTTCAGGQEGTARPGDFADLDFDALGYDSLALMETSARLERDFGVRVPEDAASAARTPRELLDLVNAVLAEAG